MLDALLVHALRVCKSGVEEGRPLRHPLRREQILAGEFTRKILVFGAGANALGVIVKVELHLLQFAVKLLHRLARSAVVFREELVDHRLAVHRRVEGEREREVVLELAVEVGVVGLGAELVKDPLDARLVQPLHEWRHRPSARFRVDEISEGKRLAVVIEPHINGRLFRILEPALLDPPLAFLASRIPDTRGRAVMRRQGDDDIRLDAGLFRIFEKVVVSQAGHPVVGMGFAKLAGHLVDKAEPVVAAHAAVDGIAWRTAGRLALGILAIGRHIHRPHREVACLRSTQLSRLGTLVELGARILDNLIDQGLARVVQVRLAARHSGCLHLLLGESLGKELGAVFLESRRVLPIGFGKAVIIAKE